MYVLIDSNVSESQGYTNSDTTAYTRMVKWNTATSDINEHDFSFVV